MTTVSDLQEQKKLTFRRGYYNIIDCGIRTGKTYWAVNNLVQFTRDGAANRILFLVDSKILKGHIIEEYKENCVEVDDFWIQQHSSSWGEHIDKIGVMCYQKLASLVAQEKLDFLDNIDVICWDECDSIFDFAVDAFATARRTDFARKSLTNAEVLHGIQTFSTKKDYWPLILLGAWENIVLSGEKMCIGLSATPERTRAFYQSLVSASNQGKLDAGYRALNDIYFFNLVEHLKNLKPIPGHGYWCYSPFIEPNQALLPMLRDQGFNPIELHSLNNLDKPMDKEQKRVYYCIETTGMVPMEYDFVIVNRALERGFTIKDKRFDNIIVNSFESAVREQAARNVFPYQRHLRAFCPEIPKEYLNKWLILEECRSLADFLCVHELDKNNKHTTRVMTWNKLKDYLPSLGYTIETKRKKINGKLQQCYYIAGEWHDAELVDGNFLQLVEAKQELEKMKEEK